MADDPRLNIRKYIDQGSEHTTLSSLANRGIKNVKVLDEAALYDLIGRAVDEVITNQTQEERSKLLADSRKQLQKLLEERDQFMSQANLLEAGKNDLIQQVESLQNELKLRRQIEEKGEADFQDQIKELAERHQAKDARIAELESENAWLREEHDRMVEELDRVMTENRRLKEELESLRAGAASGDSARAEADELRERLEAQEALGHEAMSGLKAAHAKVAGELESRMREIEALREELEAERSRGAQEGEKDRQIEELRGQLQDERRRAQERPAPDVVARLEEEARAARRSEEELRQQLQEAKEEAERLKAPPPAEAKEPPRDGRRGKGLDIGTVNLVAAEQNAQGDVELRLRRNAFIDVEITPYTKEMLTRLAVPYVVQGKKMYVVGDPAFELANVLNRNTRRPMKDGLISAKEQDALPVMKLLIGSILGEPRDPGEVCFYSVPGEPVDRDLTVAYHRDLFDAVLKALGYAPRHIIEGHAVTFAELADEDFTGIGVSCGGGMFNICVAYKSMPALTFSTARSGDWVDLNVAQALGIKPAKAAQIKEKGVDLMSPKNREEDAVAIYYRNLIQYNLTNIAERFRAAADMPSFSEPISIVFSGGTSMAGNFIELVRAVFRELDFPIPVKELRMAKDPLHATAKGALAAAIMETTEQAA
jgi:hypothetical protein